MKTEEKIKVSIGTRKIDSIIRIHIVDITVNSKQLKMKVTVVDGEYDDSIEDGTNVWNSLTLEEKDAVEDALINLFGY